MIRASEHSRTGVYWIRKGVPMTLRATELVRSLETKDPWGAKRRVGPVIDEFEGIIEAAGRGECPETSPRAAPCLVQVKLSRKPP